MKVQDLINQLSRFNPNDDIILKERNIGKDIKMDKIRSYKWKDNVVIDGWVD